MKIAIAQLNYHIGDFQANKRKMISHIHDAKKKGVDIIVFGELATCGYPPRDFLEFDDFIEKAEETVLEIADEARGIAIVLGSPTRNPVLEGKDLFNSALFLHEGKIVHAAHKTLLPTYDIFDEYRYFEPGKNFELVEYKGAKIALTVCEDIWNVGNENPLYTVCPLDELNTQNPDFIINISASPFTQNKARQRINILRENVNLYQKPIFYCNHVGAQTEIIFDGGSIAMNEHGVIIEELPYFEEIMGIYDLAEVSETMVDNEQEKEKYPLMFEALICGIRDYFSKLKFSSAIIGLSGGIDSALTTVLATYALGAHNVRVLMLPSRFSSDHSVSDSEQLVETLSIRGEVVPIHKTYNAVMDEMHPLFEHRPFDVTEENIQARIRGMMLMAISNKFGNILLNTSNKSEMAVGYGTLYGDLAGGMSVLGDIYKTEVYALSRYINRDEEIIPWNIINKEPSAELRPDQKDSDSLPEYAILDRILHQYIELRKSPDDIIEQGYDSALVKRIIRMVNLNEFKRYQTAPVLRVSEKAFGMGRRMPIVAKYLS